MASAPSCPARVQAAFTCSLVLGAAALAQPAQADVGCPNGARVEDARYCRFFATFRDDDAPQDRRILAAFGAKPGDPVRSMALVIAVGRYPHLPPNSQLPAAQNDGTHLASFLADSQQFDEVVLLRDEDATQATIDYFLHQYFSKEAALYPGRTRFLFAFSGHGTPADSNGLGGSIALSEAQHEQNDPNLLDLHRLRDDIYDLDRRISQVIVLLNSCYGGGIFSLAREGGNENVVSEGGARGITAASPNNLAYAYAGKENGSIFFDTLIQGVENGQADTYPPQGGVNDVRRQREGGYIRFGRLFSYLTDQIEGLDAGLPAHRFDPPWSGIVDPIDEPALLAKGGFFFLTPRPSPGAPAPQMVHLEASDRKGTGGVASFSFPGQHAVQPVPPLAPALPPPIPAPEPKVLPDTPGNFYSWKLYPVRGVDASHFGQHIDWSGLKKATNIRFVYMKATEGGDFKDLMFQRNWVETKRVGLYHGAYHYFTFCTPVSAQLANIVATVPKEHGALPLAIDLGFYLDSRREAAHPSREQGCFKAAGTEAVWGRIEELVDRLAEHYGKRPIVFINDGSGRSLGQHVARSGLWVQRLGDAPAPTTRPWTLWQYSTPVLGKFDFDAFHGTAAEFDRFRAGRSE